MPVNQAVSGRGEARSSGRFSIGEDDFLTERSASDISSADNKSKDVQKSCEKDSAQKNKYADEKQFNEEPSQKLEKDNKQEVNSSNKTAENADDDRQEDEEVKSAADYIINDLAKQVFSGQTEIAKVAAVYVTEQSNALINQAANSRQIEIPQEMENGWSGIQAIMPEGSNWQNGLQQIQAQINENQSDAVLPEVQILMNNANQSSSEEAEQITSGTIVNENNQANNIDIESIMQGQKQVLTDNVSDGQDKQGEGDINLLKAVQQISHANKKLSQNPNTENEQNRDQADLDKNVLEGTAGGKSIFNDGIENKNNNLNQRPDLADILTYDVEVNDQTASILDSSKIVIEPAVSNTEMALDKSSVLTFDKANPDIMRENANEHVSAQISRQITESIHSSTLRQGEEKQITVRLNPPELGTVLIKFSEQDSRLTGILEVSNSQTRVEIEQALPDIIRSLSENGIQLKKVDVVSTDTGDGNNDALQEQLYSGDQSGQNSSSEQYNGGDYFNKDGFRQWFSNTMEYSRDYSRQNHFANAGSINVLA